MKYLIILLFPLAVLAQWDFPTNPIVVDSTSVTVDSVCNEGKIMEYYYCRVNNSRYNDLAIHYESGYDHRWIYSDKIQVQTFSKITTTGFIYYIDTKSFIPFYFYSISAQYYRICKVCRRKELITFTIHWHYQADEFNFLDKELECH